MARIGVDVGGTHTEYRFSTLPHRVSGLRLYTLKYYI